MGRRNGGWTGPVLLRNPQGLGGSGRACLVFPLPTWLRGACWAPEPGPPPSEAPSGHVGPRGVGWREEGGRGREMDSWGGTLRDQRIRGGVAGVSPAHSGPRKAAGGPGWVLCLLGPPPAALVLGWGGEEERRMERGSLGSEDQGGAQTGGMGKKTRPIYMLSTRDPLQT